MNMADLLKKGVLPESGGALDQPWRLMELILYTQRQVTNEERRTMGMMFPLFQLMG